MGKIGIPKIGVPKAELLERMRASKKADADWRGGRTWSLVYHVDEQHTQLLRDAYGLFISENLLNPMAFKSLKRMEHEVVRMSAAMLHGGPNVVGTMTSGGTESILLAMKTYRELAQKAKPGLRRPEVVLPRSAHAAFDKAAHYFGLKLIHTPGKDDFTADPEAMAKRITRRTALLVASAPQYPQGVMDPIEDLGRLAQKRKLPLHVDSCIGGFMLPWVEKLGRPVPPFDFRVPGVTSISADIHKYGFAAKGASVILYRDMSLLKHQFFIETEWPGGIYASATMPGTRSGGAVAAAWAAMNALGEKGYMGLAEKAMQATDLYIAGIHSIPELEVMGSPVMSLVAFRSRDPAVDVYVVADKLEEKGWHMDRQHKPACLHATVTGNHKKIIGTFLADLKWAVSYAKKHPEAANKGNAAMYGMAAKLPLRGLVKISVQRVLEGMYGPDGKIPEPGDGGAAGDDKLMAAALKLGSPLVNFADKILRGIGLRKD